MLKGRGNSELETVIKNKLKHSRYYVSSGYLQKDLIIAKEPAETMFQMLKGR